MYKLDVSAPSGSYPIIIEAGILDKIGDNLKAIFKGKKIALVTDTNIDPLYGDKVVKSIEAAGFQVFKAVVMAGEESKSFETLIELYNKFLDFKINRGDLIVALGGGVVGDLTGFAASTFLRGVPFVQVPTSLLAQVDSSVGGKVAVDLPRGKNLVGSFYQPKAVFIDPSVLNTLTDKFFNDGMGEVIKYGAIRDEKLFVDLENYADKAALIADLDRIIYICCGIKAAIVEADEKDTGDRMLLNFGHTIGHGIEQFYNYTTYSHGEAVAMGMYAISLIGEELELTKKGTAERIKDVLIKYGLPYNLPEIKSEVIIEAIGHDKKNIGDAMNFILVEQIGMSFIQKIDKTQISDYLSKLFD